VFPALLIVAAVAAGSVPAASALARARWPARSPAAAIVLWQALGLGWGLAAVGVLAGLGARSDHAGVALSALAFARQMLTGDGPGGLAGLVRLGFVAASLVLFVLLVWVLVASAAAVLRARRRQRELLSLLGHGDPKVPGALVVDHPAAAAYCVPGLRSRIVVSAGTLELLDQAELAAVLAHERSHLRERHDLVLLPFTALLRAFRFSAARRGLVTVPLEMLADDHAVGYAPRRPPPGSASQGGAAAGPWPRHGAVRVGAAGPGTVPRGAPAVADGGDVACAWRGCSPLPGLRVAALALVGGTPLALVACLRVRCCPSEAPARSGHCRRCAKPVEPLDHQAVGRRGGRAVGPGRRQRPGRPSRPARSCRRAVRGVTCTRPVPASTSTPSPGEQLGQTAAWPAPAVRRRRPSGPCWPGWERHIGVAPRPGEVSSQPAPPGWTRRLGHRRPGRRRAGPSPPSGRRNRRAVRRARPDRARVTRRPGGAARGVAA
jgi:hypothetical protein